MTKKPLDVDPIWVACPYCLTRAGKQCMGNGLRRLPPSKAHKARVEAARLLGEAKSEGTDK